MHAAAALALLACRAPGQYGGPLPIDQPGVARRLAVLCSARGASLVGTECQDAPPGDAQPAGMGYPPTLRQEVVERLHGVQVSDPYRWLEEGESPKVIEWTRQQNELSRHWFDSEPARGKLRDRLTELFSMVTVHGPLVRVQPGGKVRYFFVRQRGEDKQPILYFRDGLGGSDVVAIDANQWSTEGSAALDWWEPSSAGDAVAYGRSQNGDEQSTLYVRDLVRGRDREDVIPRTPHASLAWEPSGAAFYYTRYPERGKVPAGEELYHRTVYRHLLGSPPDDDALVFGDGLPMTDSPSVLLSPNGRWLVVAVHKGWSKTELYLRDTSRKNGALQPMVRGVEAVFDPVVRDDAIYVRTNDGAPRYRAYRVDPRAPERTEWVPIVEQSADTMTSLESIGGELFATYLVDASSQVRRFSPRGRPLPPIELPPFVHCSAVSGAPQGREAFLEISSFTAPTEIRRVALGRDTAEPWQTPVALFDPSRLEVRRRSASSKDGTRVPYFLVRQKSTEPSSPRPTVLYGYGGFAIDVIPSFPRSTFPVLERGGVLVFANLRGGGEFGEGWHRQGMLEQKQHVFDDATAVAEQLLADGTTDRDHLAIMGRSNGGLLVSALVTQRPELFRAAVASVPITDMLRYDRFRIAKLWVSEYGSADNADQFDFLRAYSPYHHVHAQTPYPAVLITTGASDSRVDPLHSRKMVAALQAATESDLPILLRSEEKAGHGAGKPATQLVDEFADIDSFLFRELGIPFDGE